MQLAAKSEHDTATGGSAEPAKSADSADPADSDYVGKHRPHRMSMLRSRVRVSQLAERDSDSPSK